MHRILNPRIPYKLNKIIQDFLSTSSQTGDVLSWQGEVAWNKTEIKGLFLSWARARQVSVTSVSTNTNYPGSVGHVNQYFHLRLSDLCKTVDLLKRQGKSAKGENLMKVSQRWKYKCFPPWTSLQRSPWWSGQPLGRGSTSTPATNRNAYQYIGCNTKPIHWLQLFYDQ